MATPAAARRPDRPVLIVNPRSGGGKARQHDLVGQCRARGIEAVVLAPGDDVSAVAAAVASAGADVIGAAGGDGSQAAVAAVAAEHGLAYVCVPAGTRNHFALDLGVDREDVVGALDAFFDGAERRIDLARVNGRVFVNNASMGVYGRIVQSDAYRDAKVRTVIDMLPRLVGPEAAPFDLRFVAPDGYEYDTAAVLLVSNNRYEIDRRGRYGTRGSLDRGTLGVVAVRAGPPPHGLKEWSAPALRVDSGAAVEVGLDGEAVTVEPPLLFESVPSALRVRTLTRRRARRPVSPRLRRPSGGGA